MEQSKTRDGYLRRLLSYCGISEGGTEHREIVEMYNRIEPIPRGYAASVQDPWCAIFLCAVAWDMGLRDWPWECSCSRIMQEAQKRGIWRQDWNEGGLLGQWVLYDLNGDGSADHIGCVVRSDGGEVWVVEGNYGDTVKVRRIQAGDTRVLGFVDVEYQEQEDGIYNTVEEVPEAYRSTIERLIARGALRGYGSTDRLGLSEELCRTLVVLERLVQSMEKKY